MDEKRLSKKAAKLTRMAEEEFGKVWEPTYAEHELLSSAPTTNAAYGGPSEEDSDQSNDPAGASNWEHDRNIDARLIRWLCSERGARDLVDPSGIEIHGARIVGGLDLAYMVLPFPLVLMKCSLDEKANLTSLEVSDLSLAGSWVKSLNAERIHVKGSLFLRDGFHAEGEVRLLGAQIDGNFECNGGRFMNPPEKGVADSGVALNADDILIKGGAFLGKGFHAHGEVRLLGCANRR